MKDTKILIIHGYSDCSKSFRDIKAFLHKKGYEDVESILYADYQSREDALTFNDVVDGLNDELIKHKVIKNNGGSDYRLKIIVHSTGGLVVRHWIWRYYHSCNNFTACPVSNIVMLAPANFGSPLAHRGRSFLGSLVKGRWKVGDFLEVGKELLFGLELASPYQWKLAHRDLLTEGNYFQPDKIKTTVIVGDNDYDGMRGWVNKPGTDGTVVISGTNLNTIKLTLGLAARDSSFNAERPHMWTSQGSVSKLAFGVVSGFDHGSIVEDAHKAPEEDILHPGNIIFRGLTDDREAFDQLRTELENNTAMVFENNGKPMFQQFIVHTVDDHDEPVYDFTMEFFVYPKEHTTDKVIVSHKFENFHEGYSKKIEEIITCQMHQHTLDRSYRRFLVNHKALAEFMDTAAADEDMKGGFVISMRVHLPPIEKNIRFDETELRNIVIYESDAGKEEGIPALFFPNTTTLLELQVDRTNSYVRVGPEPIEQ